MRERIFVYFMVPFWCFCFVTFSHADSGDWGEILEWAKQQKPKVGTMVTWGSDSMAADYRGVTYFTGPSLGSGGWGIGADGSKPYIDADIGIIWPGNIEPLFLIMVHPANLAGPIWRRMPLRNRLSLPKMPPIEVGPAIKLPTGKTWVIGREVGVVASLKFGG